MSEPPLSANPEFLFHYERLRRERAWMRRRAYVLLIAAGGLLAFMIFAASTTSSKRTVGPGFFDLFIGLALLLIWNAVVAFRRSGQPIQDSEVARIRQEERQQLFQFAQGRISWRYWLGVVIQFLIGILFLSLGGEVALSLVDGQNPQMDGLLSLAFILFAWYSLARAIRGALLLRRLAKLSGQELADRLSLGEATEGE